MGQTKDENLAMHANAISFNHKSLTLDNVDKFLHSARSFLFRLNVVLYVIGAIVICVDLSYKPYNMPLRMRVAFVYITTHALYSFIRWISDDFNKRCEWTLFFIGGSLLMMVVVLIGLYLATTETEGHSSNFVNIDYVSTIHSIPPYTDLVGTQLGLVFVIFMCILDIISDRLECIIIQGYKFQ